MSNYTKSTNFAAKDSLSTGDANKIVKGTEINTEFDNIATAVATKANSAAPTFTGTTTINELSLTTDLALTHGGTGASDAATARTNLDVPTRSGGDVSGTWGISITGNAATAPTTSGNAATATTLSTATAGSMPSYSARAFVYFDGKTGSTATIKSSGNISSVTRDSTGVYTINFDTDMNDTNYAPIATAGGNTTNDAWIANVYELYTDRCVLTVRDGTNNQVDSLGVFMAVFR